jgi:hypothetical protein
MTANQKQSQEIAELWERVRALEAAQNHQGQPMPTVAPSIDPGIPESALTQYHIAGSQQHGNMRIVTLSRKVAAGVHVLNVVVVGSAMCAASSFIPGAMCKSGEVV